MSKAPNNFTSQITKKYYAKTSCKVSKDLDLSNLSDEVIKKSFLSIDTSKASGTDQIPVKCLTDGAEVMPLPLRNIINLSIKLSIFPEEGKIAKS